MKASIFTLLLGLSLSVFVSGDLHLNAQTSGEPNLQRFKPKPAPASRGAVLKPKDRLAICGDSITEQRMYSRVMETYLTTAHPDLDLEIRQYGWGGETAEGFLRRMTNDVLRFKPTVATTCYGMNDHRYRPYSEEIGAHYQANMSKVLASFKAAGTRVIIGSPGCVGKVPGWTKSPPTSVDDLNLNLLELRNIDVDLAHQHNLPFADVFWPMFLAHNAATSKYGTNFAIPGKDGVHPGWAGSFIMAYSFLKAMELDGEIGLFQVDLKNNQASASKGHEVVSLKDGKLVLESRRYPFCATGTLDSDNSIRAALQFVPFQSELNRFLLIVRNADRQNYKVTWGSESKTFSAAQLAQGINLVEAFTTTPFQEAFDRVDKAVAAKQEYETRQVKQLFHGPEAKTDMKLTAELTERTRAPLVKAIRKNFVPVRHEIVIQAE